MNFETPDDLQLSLVILAAQLMRGHPLSQYMASLDEEITADGDSELLQRTLSGFGRRHHETSHLNFSWSEASVIEGELFGLHEVAAFFVLGMLGP